ncbi:AAA family ATPase [Planctomicrobium sp. SH668]|uniref:AAA family ATPase n=1 Tax=Planctomicrobium sp. SH668 TaxID=3448126 RepID=UPI003F5BE101
MDTLGTITPRRQSSVDATYRSEAMERLRYLAQTGHCGLLSGSAGSGKSLALAELGESLRREGLTVLTVNLSGVSSSELPTLISTRLGAGLPHHTDSIELWSWLQEYAESTRRLSRRLVILVDHLDRAEESLVAPLSRLIENFGSSCSWIFAGVPEPTSAWTAFLGRHFWLRVELKPLATREVGRLLANTMAECESSPYLTQAGVDAAVEASNGSLRKMQQIADLAALTAEIEKIEKIDAELIRSLIEELV